LADEAREEGGFLRVWLLVALVAVGIAVFAMLGSRRACAPMHAEGANTLGWIVRGVAAVFNGTRVSSADAGAAPAMRGRMCGSAVSVPKDAPPPAGARHTPEGSDFVEGSAEAGWPCLGIQLTQGHRFRYSYHVGSDYLGPRRGLADPGPNGFEAAAQANCFDGSSLLYTRIGWIADNGELYVDPTLHATSEDPEDCFDPSFAPPATTTTESPRACR
jgi:hypothetical protein